MFEKVREFLSKYFDRHPAAKRTAGWVRKRKRRLLTCFFVFAHLAGALTSVRAIMEVRTAQGAIAWTVALNTVPYVSVPAYWIFGRSKFQGYVIARRNDLAHTSPIHQQYLANLTNRGLVANPTLEIGRAHV